MNGELFRESNTIVPVTASVLLGIMCVILFGFAVYEIYVAEDFELSSAGGITLLATATIMIVISALVFMLRIKTVVTYESLTVGTFRGRTVPVQNISSVAAEDFSAMRDYLGWGLRIGKKGIGYISAGTNRGLRINLGDGKSFFISSKRTFELESAVNKAIRARAAKQ